MMKAVKIFFIADKSWGEDRQWNTLIPRRDGVKKGIGIVVLQLDNPVWGVSTFYFQQEQSQHSENIVTLK